jgi:hypothetical protein
MFYPHLPEPELIDVIYRSPQKIVAKLRPGATNWHVEGSPYYESLVWQDEDYSKPTEDEWNAELERLKQEFIDAEYQRKRMFEYPDLGEFVDAFYWMQKGDTTKMESYIQKCDEIKNKYPKES